MNNLTLISLLFWIICSCSKRSTDTDLALVNTSVVSYSCEYRVSSLCYNFKNWDKTDASSFCESINGNLEAQSCNQEEALGSCDTNNFSAVGGPIKIFFYEPFEISDAQSICKNEFVGTFDSVALAR